MVNPQWAKLPKSVAGFPLAVLALITAECVNCAINIYLTYI